MKNMLTLTELILDLMSSGFEVSFTPFPGEGQILVRAEERAPSGFFVERLVATHLIEIFRGDTLASTLAEMRHEIDARPKA